MSDREGCTQQVQGNVGFYIYKWMMDFHIIPAKVIAFLRFVMFTACS